MQAIAVYFSQFQLLPLQRPCEALSDLCHAPISQGSVRQWIAQGAKILEPSQERLKELLLSSRLQHVDETSLHLNVQPWLCKLRSTAQGR